MTDSPRTKLVMILALVAALAPGAQMASAGAAAAGPAAVPAPNTSVKLPITSFHQLVADEAHGELFMRTLDTVLVTDLTGQKIRTLKNVTGSGDMAMSEDGSILWVALTEQRRILRVDASDATKDGTVNLPDDVCPVGIAETNGKLAVAYHCSDMGTRGFGVVALGDGSWTPYPAQIPAFAGSSPMVATASGAPDLVVAGLRTAPATLYVFDTSGAEPALVTTLGGLDAVTDLVMHPSGDLFVAAFSGTPSAQAYSVPNLGTGKSYDAGASALGAAWSADGTVLVTGRPGPEGIRVFKKASTAPKIAETVENNDVLGRGMAVDATGHLVWAVTMDGASTHRLNVLPGFGWGKCKGKLPTIVGTDGDDHITGTSSDDVIAARGGNDVIAGLDGDDTLCGGAGWDVFDPGFGNDVVVGGGGQDTARFSKTIPVTGVSVDLSNLIATGQGTDTLLNLERVIGTDDSDVIIGNGKPNLLHGGDGDDTILGLGKADTIYGEGGSDLVDGGAAGDHIYGGRGDDLLVGGDGKDTLLGQGNDDTLAGVGGDDVIQGGPGHDTASFALSGSGVTVSLVTNKAKGEGADKLNSIEDVVGTEFDDHLIGNGVPNYLESRGGDDWLEGAEKGDLLYGGADEDTLDGGPGYDACIDGEHHISCEYIAAVAPEAAPAWAGWALGEKAAYLPQLRWRPT